jgi:hypothetical protein
MPSQYTYNRGQLVYAAVGISRGDVLVCLTNKDEKNKISYVPIGEIGLIVSNCNTKNVKVSWANGTIGWVNADGVKLLSTTEDQGDVK